jgi:Icc-related predicted phosphoesterase
MAFSDLHHSASRAEVLVEAAQEADLVIGAGDFCNARRGLPKAMALLDGITAPLVVVPGNAESDTELKKAARKGIHALHGEHLEIGGLRLFGMGYGVPPTPFGAWSCDMSEAEAESLLSRCNSVDILITHSPPKGVADVTSQGISVGSTAIRAAIETLQPQLALCGHIHDSWGQTGQIGATQVVNLGPTPNWFKIDA